MLPNEKASLEDEYSYEYFIRRDAFSNAPAVRKQVVEDYTKAGWSISWGKKVEQVDKDKLCRSGKHRIRSEELSEYLKKNPIQVLEIG